jgi:hypothetical protein
MLQNRKNRNSQSDLRYYPGYVLEAPETSQNESYGQVSQFTNTVYADITAMLIVYKSKAKHKEFSSML